MADPARPQHRPLWLAPLAVGVLALLVQPQLDGLAGQLLYATVGFATIPAILLGIRLHRPAERQPWLLLVVVQLLFLAGDGLLWAVPGSPSPADALYLAGYASLIIVVMRCIRHRQPGRDLDGFLDAALIVTALAVMTRSFSIQPVREALGLSMLEAVAQIGHPLITLVLVGTAARLLMSMDRPPAVWLIVGALLTLPIGEVLRTAALLGGDPALADRVLLVWITYHALLAAGALHPSMTALVRRVPDQERPLVGRRLAALLAIALATPAVLVVQLLRGAEVEPAFVTVSMLVVGGLLVLRLLGERRRALEDAERTVALVELLRRVAAAANEAVSVQDAIATIVGDVCRTLDWDVGHAFLPSDESGSPLVSSDLWYPTEDPVHAVLRELTQSRTFPADDGIAGRALSDGAPVWISDVTDDDTHLRGRLARERGQELGVRTHVAFPVVTDGEVVAVLEFFSHEVRGPDERATAVAEAIGTQLGRVLERQQTERAMASSRDAALEASRLKSEFLATMSHEIRTPMNAVIGMTGLLLDSELDEAQLRYASSVRVAAESLMTILNDILDFSKLEAGRFELEELDLRVDRIVEEVADLLDAGTHGKPVDIHSYCHPDTPTALRGDAGRLRQVLLNLIGNAVKFTPEGEVVVRVKAEPGTLTDTHVTLRFEVVDTGIGLTDEVAARLFEPFEQGDRSTTRRFGGTGLGLSICRRIVTLMGGDIGVESAPGEGSLFWFTVPFQRREVQPGEVRHSLPLQDRRVLVLDHNPTNRAIVQGQVAAWGMRPVTVANGPDAITALKDAAEVSRPFDIALLDLNMPDIDGLEVARRIGADPAIRDVRLGMLTSSDGADEARLAREAGIGVFLRKPVRQSQLYDALMELMLPGAHGERSRRRRETTPTPRRRGSILLVEDNPANQIVGARMTERWGYRVDVVSDGQEALDALARIDYDAVLMDCQMPIMDGFEATRRLRATPGSMQRVPVIAMTASAMTEDRDRCFAAGMDDFLTKPVHREDLGGALARWIPAHEGAMEADPATAHAEAGVEGDAARHSDGDTERSEPPLLDGDRWDMLVTLTAQRPEALGAMVRSFLAEAPDRVAQISASADDAEVAERAAHSLKGSSATLGAAALAAVAERVESLLRSGEQPDAASLVDLSRCLDRSDSALRSALEAARP